MKVVHVITGLHVGGAEAMLLKLLGAMDGSSFRHEVVSLLPGGENRAPVEALGIPVHDLGLNMGRPTFAAVLSLRRLARELAPDLIQGWMYHGNLVATLLGKFAAGRPPVVWNIRHSVDNIGHEKISTRMVIRIGALLSGSARKIIYNSGISREQHALLGYRRDLGLMLPNGFDLDKFKPDPAARAGLRTELGLDPEATLVGVIGRRHPQKSHDDFLRSAAEVNRRRPEVHFVLAGRGVVAGDPSFREYLKGRDLTGRIHFLGPRSDTPRLFAALDLLAMTSVRGEGFPNVLGEAMACGIPCVATDVGESRKIVGDTGSIVPPGEPGALAAAIDAMLDLEDSVRSDLGYRGRARIMENYSLENVAERYGELYKSV